MFSKDGWLTCWLTHDEVCALIHFKLTGVVSSMLLTQPLHLFTLCAGEACYTNSTTTQHRAQIVFNGQLCVPEKTVGGMRSLK